MKKQILNLGKALNKNTQKEVNGGKMDITCEDFGWTLARCEAANGSFDPMYRKCC